MYWKTGNQNTSFPPSSLDSEDDIKPCVGYNHIKFKPTNFRIL